MLTRPSNKHKAQSAMEYLMTYGWAILIIAVVLGALFSLGVFSGSSLLGNACIASSGFLCQSPVYNHANDLITVQIGQNTGTSWTSANFVFIPQGTPSASGIPALIGTTNTFGTNAVAPAAPASIVGAMISGQTQSIGLPVNALGTGWGGTTNPANTITVGQAATGAIWVAYQTSATGPLQYAQVASINIKAS